MAEAKTITETQVQLTLTVREASLLWALMHNGIAGEMGIEFMPIMSALGQTGTIETVKYDHDKEASKRQSHTVWHYPEE